jgi:hypothetical protein
LWVREKTGVLVVAFLSVFSNAPPGDVSRVHVDLATGGVGGEVIHRFREEVVQGERVELFELNLDLLVCNLTQARSVSRTGQKSHHRMTHLGLCDCVLVLKQNRATQALFRHREWKRGCGGCR